MLGNKVSADEAKNTGLVHKVVPADRVNHEAFNLACQIACNPPDVCICAYILYIVEAFTSIFIVFLVIFSDEEIRR